jgi:hypothetical protein
VVIIIGGITVKIKLKSELEIERFYLGTTSN